MEWDYGAYEGLTTPEIRERHPGWSLWNDGVPEGERAAQVGERVDRVIARAKAVGGDTLCVAHGHVLRVLAARWLGLPPIGGRLLCARIRLGQCARLGPRRPCAQPLEPGTPTAPLSSGGPAAPPWARMAMSAKVKDWRWPRMVSPTSAQTARRTHWPS